MRYVFGMAGTSRRSSWNLLNRGAVPWHRIGNIDDGTALWDGTAAPRYGDMSQTWRIDRSRSRCTVRCGVPPWYGYTLWIFRDFSHRAGSFDDSFSNNKECRHTLVVTVVAVTRSFRSYMGYEAAASRRMTVMAPHRSTVSLVSKLSEVNRINWLHSQGVVGRFRDSYWSSKFIMFTSELWFMGDTYLLFGLWNRNLEFLQNVKILLV